MITGALSVQWIRRTFDTRLVCGVHPLSDVGRLGTDSDIHATGQTVEAFVGMVVADVEDAVAHGVGDVGERGLGGRRHFTHDVDLARRHERFDGDPRPGIIGEQGIQHRIADGVANLVGVPFGHRLTGKQPRFTHSRSLPLKPVLR